MTPLIAVKKPALEIAHIQRWIASKGNYLFNQTALSRVFRGKFMQLLHRACQMEKLTCDRQ
jgi:hypothetical protein